MRDGESNYPVGLNMILFFASVSHDVKLINPSVIFMWHVAT